jgi:hypothetical protein
VTMVLILLISSLLGAGMGLVSPWLPVLLASILTFLAALICGLAVGESVLRACGSAVLAMILLQVGYVAAGRMRESRLRRVVPAKNLPSEE